MGAPQADRTDSGYTGSHLTKGDWVIIDPTSHPNKFLTVPAITLDPYTHYPLPLPSPEMLRNTYAASIPTSLIATSTRILDHFLGVSSLKSEKNSLYQYFLSKKLTNLGASDLTSKIHRFLMDFSKTQYVTLNN